MRAHVLTAGQRFGRLVVLSEADSVKHKRRLLCRCDCGTVKSIRVDSIIRCGQRSCGCLRNELSGRRAKAFRRHGEAVALTTEYIAWQAMIRRCTAVNGPKWRYYGGRGIAVCDRWRHSFEQFLADVGRRPGKGFSLDRINNDGHYEPGNVRWADAVTQNRNRRRSAA
jgi:hypothetical protein